MLIIILFKERINDYLEQKLGQYWAYWAIILSILIIKMFKERINDYLEKKLGQYLENWPRHCNFCRPRNFLKSFENLIFKLETTVTRPFLKILSSSFLLASPFLVYKKILH